MSVGADGFHWQRAMIAAVVVKCRYGNNRKGLTCAKLAFLEANISINEANISFSGANIDAKLA